FDQHLWKIPRRELDMAYVNEPGEKLAVFPDGPPADAQNFRVHETFTTGPPPARYTTLSAWESRRAALLATLQAKVFAAVPRKAEENMPVRTQIRKAAKAGESLPAVLYIAS